MPAGHSGWAAGGGRPVCESEFGPGRVAVLARCRAATRRALMAQATMLSPPAAFSDERPFPSPFLATHSSFIRQTVDHIGGLVPDRRFRLHAGIAPSPSPSSTTDYLWAHLFSGGAVNSTWFCMPYYQPPARDVIPAMGSKPENTASPPGRDFPGHGVQGTGVCFVWTP